MLYKLLLFNLIYKLYNKEFFIKYIESQSKIKINNYNLDGKTKNLIYNYF